MQTGKLIRMVVEARQLVMTVLLENGTEIEVTIGSEDAILIGDDIFHGMYTQEDDEGRGIRKISRTVDPASGMKAEIEYVPKK